LATSLQYAFIDYSPYALGLDACLYRKKLKWNEAYPQKLVVALMQQLLLTLLIRLCPLMLANRQKLRMQICCNGLPNSLDGLLHNLTPTVRSWWSQWIVV
jgi:hypothetical protein